MNMHTKRSACRLCDSNRLELRVPIVATPIGGSFVSADALGQVQATFPLDLYQCVGCRHIQVLDVINPEVLFAGEYTYFSGKTSIVKHFEKLAQGIMRRNELPRGSLVVDIGSNDGAFLQFFKDAGMVVLGVDPARNVAKYANEIGIPTLPEMFDGPCAANIRKKHGPAQVVTANNVFAHTDDMFGMAQAVTSLLAPDGVFVFEVSYFLDVADKLLLGAIFHEHLCYHTVMPLIRFLRRAGMELIDVQRVPIQGGSLVCTAQLASGTRAVAGSVAELLKLEEKRGVHSLEYLDTFRQRLDQVKTEVGTVIRDLKDRGKSIAAFGAARGGALYLYHYEMGKYIDYIVDDDPAKQGQYSPGFHIPVLPTATMYERQPDYVVVLAWVHSNAIVDSHQRFLENGGRFIVFHPEFAIVGR